MRLVNLTPHPVVIKGQRFESEGVARVATTAIHIDDIDVNFDSFPVFRQTFGEVIGLPDPQPGTIFVVSRLVHDAVKNHRTDTFVPFGLIRDENGNIIGAEGLEV